MPARMFLFRCSASSLRHCSQRRDFDRRAHPRFCVPPVGFTAATVAASYRSPGERESCTDRVPWWVGQNHGKSRPMGLGKGESFGST